MDISSVPAVSQRILHNGKEYTTVKEGLAYILIPSTASTAPQTTPRGDHQSQSVFYNPIQQFNRDLSVLAIKAYGEEVLERKQNRKQKNRQNLNEKKSLKRKAQDGPNGNAMRKAGKIDGVESTPTAKKLGEAVDREGQVQEQHNEAGEQEMKDAEVAPAEPMELEAIEEVGAAEERLEDQQREAPPANGEMEFTNDASDAAPAKAPKPPSFTILDALSATGLRALRYVHEIPFTTSVTANDLLPAATETINLNVQHNKLENKIKSVTGNALSHMYNLVGENTVDQKGRSVLSRKYDVIDLDPYGTAAPFLDAAVQAVRDDGGLLCVTCTDAGVWASNGYPEKSYSLYGGVPIKGMQSHEGGLRLILHAIAASAARYGMAIEPLLSLSIDFYARVFVRIHKSPADVKYLAGKTMVVNNCDVGCGAWSVQMLARNKLCPNKSGKGHYWKHTFEQAALAGECSHCGTRTHLAGPMYAGPIHSPEFIERILVGLPNVSKDIYNTLDRIEGMLTLALEETLPSLKENPDSPTSSAKTKQYDPTIIDHYPFFFIPSVLSKILHCQTPHENALRGALRHLGYRVTRSHTKPGSIKTDAPWDVIWEILRQWVKQKAPVKEGAIREGTAGWRIMRMGDKAVENGDAKPKVVFDESLGREKDTKKLVRYQANPRENWGPMNRATG